MKFFSQFAQRGLAAFVIGILIAPLAAQNASLDKPFLDANDFYLRSAGFRVRLANDPVTQKALHALPPHKIVTQKTPAGVWYVFADPKVCMCIFAGTRDNLESYRSIVANPTPGVDNVPPSYTTQASALLGDMSDIDSDTLADFLRDYF
jgi:hypothetical protein